MIFAIVNLIIHDEVCPEKDQLLLVWREWFVWHPCTLVAKDSGLECTCMNNDAFTVLVRGGGRCHWVPMCTVLCGCYIQNDWAEQWICIKFWVKPQHSSMETIWMIQKAAAMDNWWLAASSWQCARSCITSLELFGETSNHSVDLVPYSRDLAPCNFWLFPKLKSPLKGKRFQTVGEIQEYMTGQLMVTGRTVWGPKVPTLKGTEASLSCIQCILYLLQ